jgi:protein SCO1
MRLAPILLSAPLLLMWGCGAQGHRELDSFNQVPRFSLVTQDGQEFHSAELDGKVWIASFFFTNCNGPCPRMSSQVRRLQTELENLPEIRFISLTVDPERDTVGTLSEYAKRFQAQSSRWLFLTGPRETLHRLSRDVFMLGDVDGSLQHSTRFILVDRAGAVRGYYISEDPEALKQLEEDARLLAKASRVR